MAKYQIKTDNGTFEVEVDSTDTTTLKTSASQYVSAAARPILTGVGAVGGGVLGSGLGPVGTVSGGALGYATGKSAADLLDRALGVKAPIKNIAQAGKETLGNINEGAQAEALGMALPGAYQGVKGAVKGIGRQLEQMSGIAPRASGSLERVAENPSLMFAPGKKAVSQMYQTAKAGETLRPDLVNTAGNKNFVNQAAQLADAGQLNPTEALTARKAVDELNLNNEVKDILRKKFDAIAKKKFSGSDSAYKNAITAESVRNFFPQNKYGGASPFKMLLAQQMGAVVTPPLFSPAAQGVAAAGVGMANRAINPLMQDPRALAAMLLQAVKSNRKKD